MAAAAATQKAREARADWLSIRSCLELIRYLPSSTEPSSTTKPGDIGPGASSPSTLFTQRAMITSGFSSSMIAKRLEKASVDRFAGNAGVGRKGFEWVLAGGSEGSCGWCLGRETFAPLTIPSGSVTKGQGRLRPIVVIDAQPYSSFQLCIHHREMVSIRKHSNKVIKLASCRHWTRCRLVSRSWNCGLCSELMRSANLTHWALPKSRPEVHGSCLCCLDRG